MRMTFLALATFGWLGLVTPIPQAAAQTATDGGDDTAKRIQRLEEQIVDLNAQLGTIESMRGGGGGASIPSGGGGGSDDGRLADLETQVRALSSQFSEVLNRLARIEGRGGSLAPQRGGGTNFGAADPDDEPKEQGTGFSVGGVDPQQPEPGSGGFGASVEEEKPAGNRNSGSNGNPNGGSGGGGLFGGLFGGSDNANNSKPRQTPPATAPAPGPAPQASGSQPSSSQPVRVAANSTPQAQAQYKAAYDALLQRNYRGASDGFQQFVTSFPNDPLAGSAYHWLGEAAFTSGEYKLAADSFLKSSTNYPNNEKAPESLLKLGISLKRLGENQAACSSFAELSRRFPSATPILQRAEKEKSRAQCT